MNEPNSTDHNQDSVKRRVAQPANPNWFGAMRRVMSKLLDNSRMRHNGIKDLSADFDTSLNVSNRKEFGYFPPTRCLMVPEDTEDSGDEPMTAGPAVSESNTENPPAPFLCGQTPRMKRCVKHRRRLTSAKWSMSCKRPTTLIPDQRKFNWLFKTASAFTLLSLCSTPSECNSINRFKKMSYCFFVNV